MNKDLTAKLDEVIAKDLEDIEKMVDNGESLTESEREYLLKLKDAQAQEAPSDIKWETLIAPVITGIFGILSVTMILTHENDNVITSKSFSVANKLLGK